MLRSSLLPSFGLYPEDSQIGDTEPYVHDYHDIWDGERAYLGRVEITYDGRDYTVHHHDAQHDLSIELGSYSYPELAYERMEEELHTLKPDTYADPLSLAGV